MHRLLTSCECSVKLKFLRMHCFSSSCESESLSESLSGSANSVYVTPTTPRELPTASQPRPSSPFQDSEFTKLSNSLGELFSNSAYMVQPPCNLKTSNPTNYTYPDRYYTVANKQSICYYKLYIEASPI